MNRYQLTPVSMNQKTGAIPVSMTDTSSCPNSCALKGNGCYADYGPLQFVWRRMSEHTCYSMNLEEFCAGIDYGGVIRVLAQSEKGVLFHVAGHTGWQCVGSRCYYPGGVYFWDYSKRDKVRLSPYSQTREVFKIKADEGRRLTKKVKAQLIKEYL